MLFLIYGHNGWIGQQILDTLKLNNLEYKLGKIRVDNKKELENEITNIKPTHIISLIGRTHGTIGNKIYSTIDYLEEKGKIYENVRDNLFAPIVLGLLCQKHNIHFTYLGTGCIFNYDDKHPYGKEENGFTEEDKPNFFGSSYSVVKGFTDEIMHLLEDTVLNIRIRMPITSDINSSRNFITKILKYEKICSIPNSMTVLPELLPIMIDMAKNNKTGTINLVNPGLISHNEILSMYKEIIDNNFKWTNFTIDEQDKILSAQRSNNFLDTTKLTELYPNIKNIKDSVRDILIKIKKDKTKNKIIDFYINKHTYKYFEDYLLGIFNILKNKNKIFNVKLYNPDNIIEIYNTSIFLQLLPPKLKINNIIDNNKIYVLNTEQLTRNEFLQRMELYKNNNIEIIDYSIENHNILNSYYIPYQVNQEEIYNYPKIYNACMVGYYNSPRRDLISKKLKLDIINGWKDERDKILFQYKILVNVHHSNNYNIHEHMRVDRCIMNKMIVISESSHKDELLELKNHMIIVPYNKIIETVKNVLLNYDKYYHELFDTLDIEKIKKQRKKKLLNVLDKL
jgi:dTDP-4-dehydrorhamnose reductase